MQTNNSHRKQTVRGGQVTPTLLCHLVPIIPTVLEWLRDRDLNKAATHFQSAALSLAKLTSQSVSEGVPSLKSLSDDCLIKLAVATEKGPVVKQRRKKGKVKSALTNSEVHSLLVDISKPNVDVLYVSILRIFLEANPPTVPPGMSNLAIAQKAEISPADVVGMIKNLKDWMLSNFSYQAYTAFSEFCSLLRDSLSLSGESDQLRPVAAKLAGPVIEAQVGGDFKNKAAANMLELCIKHCYKIFDSLPQKNSNWMVRGNRIEALPKKPKLVLDKLCTDLATFFMLKDSVYVDIVPDLMKSYTPAQVALGILIKYECLPYGWKDYLVESQLQNGDNLTWFKADKISFISEGSQLAVDRLKFHVPSKARQVFSDWQNETKGDEIAEVMKELIDKKIQYQKGLENFLNEYVGEIKFIAESEAFGLDAKNALGINSDQIEALMGTTLRNICELERRLCAQLEILNLLPCKVTHAYGRAGLLCKILLQNSEDIIEVYSDYHLSYEHSSTLLKALMGQSTPASQIKQVDGKKNLHLHFIEIFDELKYTNSNKPLATSVDLLLQFPVVYLPKLPLYIERMKRSLEKQNLQSDPSYELISETLSRFRVVLSEIDKGIAERASTSSGLRKYGSSAGLFATFSPLKRSRLIRQNSNKHSLLNGSYKG